MALQFGGADSSMFGGADTAVSSPSIIGATYHTFIDAAPTAVATSATPVLLTEKNIASLSTTVVVTPTVNITTEITMAATDNLAELVQLLFLTVSITAGMKEPSIKDITLSTDIIDFVETDERTLLRTGIL